MPGVDGGGAVHNVVSHKEWLVARTAFLVKEKAFSRFREDVARQRRELPWERVEKTYEFYGPGGGETLGELFEGRRQLVVYQFMFGPEDHEGCAHCSFWADHFDGMPRHLAQRDVTFVAVSRAPLAKIETFKRRMGWSFRWVSSSGSDYNFDFQASFTPAEVRGKGFFNYEVTEVGMPDREGISVFFKDTHGSIFHTYSTYARGIDMVNGTYQFLDLVPTGRGEAPSASQDWVRHHDRYKSGHRSSGNRPAIHVTRRPDGWATIHEGAERAGKVYATQREAIGAARAVAKREGVELYVHGADGRIRERASHTVLGRTQQSRPGAQQP